MEVYIKGMEMPKTCLECLLGSIFNGYKCRALNKTFDKYPLDHRMDWCPLSKIPEPHGRLIDADALINDYQRTWSTYDLQRIANAPTIIPASEGEE